ncbi:hypothetical protein OOJ91_31385 [Micromonospora lupini]|uniref:ABC transporter permease n=1 Tax=Micromonospora lupini TaxID=285679 RepID=UPI00225915C9|nr:ABC transporter permease [Micromonospora lupini]MCX5070355.1 hypothetical protein [Micromonospora lupini]
MNRIVAELLIGVRLAFSGGRRAWIRTVMAAVGVAIGAALLLFGASVPVMIQAAESRSDARNDLPGALPDVPVGDTLVVAAVEGQWRGHEIRGRLIWPDSPRAPLPPGLVAVPAEGQMYVSPALRSALAGPDGGTLRRQMPYGIAGTIEPAGLSGPGELAYYAGFRKVGELVGKGAWRVDRFGLPSLEEPLGSALYVTVAIMIATLLLPIAIFIGAAFRFGAETRDRRLAAIRLIGADNRAVLRIALGESLVPALLGLAAGTACYFLIRSRIADLGIFGLSAFPADVHPRPILAVLAVTAVLGLAAGMTLMGFRGVAVEPLGVFRRAAVWSGRLWWRLIPLAVSLALLYPVAFDTGNLDEDRAGFGVVLLVVALIPLLPYLVPLAARLLPAGPVAWQLAAQQLRRNPSASTRAVTGIVVAVTGAIALHTFFAAAGVQRAVQDHPADPSYSLLQGGVRLTPAAMRGRSAMFEEIEGVRAGTIAQHMLYDTTATATVGYLYIGDCAALGRIAALDRCADGDVFIFGDAGRSVTLLEETEFGSTAGARVPLPRSARSTTLVGSAAQNAGRSVLMTPRAVPTFRSEDEEWAVQTNIYTADGAPPALGGRIAGVAAEIDPLALFTAFVPQHDKYAEFRAALDIGSTAILLMMGIGLLLDVTARLHDRRRLLGVIAAIGARRSTVVWSLLLQAIVPLLAGLILAVGWGTALGAALMRMSEVPIRFAVAAILTPVAAGSTLVLITTIAVLLPAARRITRTEELRFE